MPSISYKLNTGAIISSNILNEASKDELRVLLYIIAKSAKAISAESISSALGLSTPRVKSSLALFGEHGILSEESEAPSVSYEFPERASRRGELDEESSLDTAREIRDSSLADLIQDIGAMLGEHTPGTQTTKHVTALKSQLALSNDYILTLAAYLLERHQLKPKRLADKAAKLVDSGIDTLEALEAYIESTERASSDEYEFRRLIGAWDRSLSPAEKRYLNKWTRDFNYGFGIIGEAYDINILNLNKLSLRYMDKLLTMWHDSGLTTIDAVRAKIDADRVTRKKPTGKKKTAEVADYTNFNANDALMAALARSYGDEKDDTED